jgi:two-component system chemotaxis response regulator CheB
MVRIGVLAIDDSALSRKVLKDAFASDPEFVAVGVVGSTGLALSRGSSDGVDVVVLDLFLVEENWREALARLRENLPRSRVLALAPDSDDGRTAVAQAVELGASEGVLRPRSDAEFSMSARAFGEKLLGRVRALAGAPTRAALPRAAVPSATPAPSALAPKASTTIQPRPTLPPRRGPKPVTRIDVVAIGVSTGGPNALAELLPGIPKDFPVPVVIVQHMPPGFTLNLAQNLNGKSRIEVKEGAEGDLVRPGLALIAPGDFHMQLQRKGNAVAVGMNRGAPENFCRPPWMCCSARWSTCSAATRCASCSPAWVRTGCSVRPPSAPPGEPCSPRTKPPASCGACRAPWHGPGSPTTSCRSRASRARSTAACVNRAAPTRGGRDGDRRRRLPVHHRTGA